MFYLSISLFFQNLVDLCLKKIMVQLILSLLEQLVNLKRLFGDLAVLIQKLIIRDNLMLFVLSKKTTICADETLILQTYEICLLRVQQTSVKAQSYPLW